MKLNQYPKAIAEAHKKVINQEESVMIAQAHLNSRDAEIERAIAFDPSLTNDQKCKIARNEAKRQHDYVMADNEVKKSQLSLKLAQVELEQLRNEFTVAKIEARVMLVEAEQQIAA